MIENKKYTQQIIMANAQSKVMEQYNEYDEEDYYYQDKLVLYLEEIDYETKTADMQCFIIYDEYEKEYLIIGQRKQVNIYGKEFKFYCKKRKNVLNYLRSIFDPKNEMTLILYNFKNLDINYNNKDEFKQLRQYTTKMLENEIVGYDNIKIEDVNCNIKWHVNTHLKNLKFVRY